MPIPSIQGNEQRQLRSTRRRDFLRREIIFTLVVKVIVIYALWYAFFSNPIDDTLTDSQVSNVVFGNSQPGETPFTEGAHTPQITKLKNASMKGEK